MAARLDYLSGQLKALTEAFDGVRCCFPDESHVGPYDCYPDITFVWCPQVDGERFLLRAHLQLPPNFGSPLAKIWAPSVEFTEPGLVRTSLLYRNSIPHTFPFSSRTIHNEPYGIGLDETIHSYPWVRVCWHLPSLRRDEWRPWIDNEWSYEEGLVPVFESCCEWLRGYIAWRELGEWLHGGVGHKADLERIKHDWKTFRRHNFASASPAALAS